MNKRSGVLLGVMVLLVTAWTFPAIGDSSSKARPSQPADESRAFATEWYPYRSEAFSNLVADSYRETPSKSISPFYRWMEDAYQRAGVELPGHKSLSLNQTLFGVGSS